MSYPPQADEQGGVCTRERAEPFLWCGSTWALQAHPWFSMVARGHLARGRGGWERGGAGGDAALAGLTGEVGAVEPCSAQTVCGWEEPSGRECLTGL